MSLHFMLAAFTKVEELQLEEKEAAQIAKAVTRLNELYGGMVLPEKTAAWLQLGFVCGTVYGPRVVAHSLRKKAERSKAKKAPVTIDGDPNAVAQGAVM